MKLVVGLGNPGKEYSFTRHNIGFMVLDNYLGDVTFKEKFNSLYCEKTFNNEKVIFIKPLTFMNNSGQAVRQFMDYYKVDRDDLLVIYDDMDFPLGTFKLKKSGSSAGHNGIKSLIEHLGSEEFKRIRVGISKSEHDVIDYVLGKFNKAELDKLNNVMPILSQLLDDYFKIDFDNLMSKYNN